MQGGAINIIDGTLLVENTTFANNAIRAEDGGAGGASEFDWSELPKGDVRLVGSKGLNSNPVMVTYVAEQLLANPTSRWVGYRARVNISTETATRRKTRVLNRYECT